MRTPVLVVAFIVVLAVGLVASPGIPPQHWPFAPLDLEQPIGLATGLKLAGLRTRPEQCRAVLERSAIAASPIEDRAEHGFCRFHNAVAIAKSQIRYSAPVRVSCPLAAALYVWEREVVTPAAARHFGAQVTRIEHIGTYSCRRVYGGIGLPSQHATANAIDVAAFRLAYARRVSVLSGWRGHAENSA